MRKVPLFKNVLHAYLEIVIFILSIIEGFYLMFARTPREGLEFLFLLPLIFGICVAMFGKIFKKRGIGLKIYYVIAIIRYMVQPLLIVLTSGEIDRIRMSVVKPSSYLVAIIIQCVEIIIAFGTIYYTYGKEKRSAQKTWIKKHSEYINSTKSLKGVSFSGWIIVGIFAAVLLYRFWIWFPALKIYWFKDSNVEGVLLENSLFSTIKTVLFLFFLNKTVNSIGKKKIFFGIITIFALLFNVLTYFGSNRSLTIEIVLASLCLLMYYFPNRKILIVSFTLPVSLVVVYTMFITKQFGINSAEEISAVRLSLQYLSNQLEEYTNGPWCVAQTYEAALDLSFLTSIKACYKELVNALMVVLQIPGLKSIWNSSIGIMSATDIFREAFQTRNRGQIPSFSAGLFYVNDVLGWILFPVANYIAIRALVRYTVKSDYTDNIVIKYLYIWSSILFGFTHCYCIRVLIYCLSKYAWFIWLIVIGENIIKIRIPRRKTM